MKVYEKETEKNACCANMFYSCPCLSVPLKGKFSTKKKGNVDCLCFTSV